MNGVVSRAYAGAADLRRMQAAASARFGRGNDHVGDLAWMLRTRTHVELGAVVTLVESRGGDLLGWTCFYPENGWFDAVAAGDDGDADIAEARVVAALETAGRAVAAGDAVPNLSALCAEDDTQLAAALSAHSFAVVDGGDLEITRRRLDDLPIRALPPGLRFSGLEDEALVEAKVECHRAAFAPSSLTPIGYRRARQTWPYRAELDRVVVDGDGRVLSSCIAWIDEANGWGLLEPVGTRPEHQRRGLAAAVCLDALHALRRAGAHSAQVVCESGSGGCATYHSIGFRTERRMYIHRLALD